MQAGPLPSTQLESQFLLRRNPLLRFLQTGYRSSYLGSAQSEKPTASFFRLRNLLFEHANQAVVLTGACCGTRPWASAIFVDTASSSIHSKEFPMSSLHPQRQSSFSRERDRHRPPSFCDFALFLDPDVGQV